MTENDTPRPRKRRDVAVAIQGDGHNPASPARVVATGHGAVARQIVALAFENGVKVREDADLAEVLALIDVDSPIPVEVMAAVTEILTYVYRANRTLIDQHGAQEGHTP
jgi:flagellar biosynthesis protein